MWRTPELGIDPAADIAQPVGALLVDDEIAPTRPVPVGELAILIDQIGQPVSGLAQLFRFEATGDLGQLRLGLRDPQQRAQRSRHRRLTQLLGRHLRQRGRQPMRHRRQPARQRLPLMRRFRPLSGR